MYVKGGEEGLMEALLTKGPMTVAVDAGHESFRFYKSGIYNNTHCHVTPVTGTSRESDYNITTLCAKDSAVL